MQDLGLDIPSIAPWFAHNQESPYVLIRVSPEHAAAWSDVLTEALRRCYVPDAALDQNAQRTGRPKSDLLAAKLPDRGSTMAGDFGEILVFVYHAVLGNPTTVVGPKKWRFKQDRTKPAPGSDVVTFVLPSWPNATKNDILLCSEVKTKSTNGDSSPIPDAIKDCEKDRTSRLAKTLVWLRDRALNDADALHHVRRFGLPQIPHQLGYLTDRGDDYYLSLVGELFERIRNPYDDAVQWSRLGNALTQAGLGWTDGEPSVAPGILASETALFAAAAFYFGGYSASAYLTLKAADPSDVTETHRTCYELLARPSTIQSASVRALVGAVRRGDLQAIRDRSAQAVEREAEAIDEGPDEWVAWRLFRQMLERFETTNLRAVLPDGESGFWDPMVRSLLNRTPPAWDFFPSQIAAVRSGLLSSPSTFSLQMPTGAGKTALSETLLFYHLKRNPQAVAVLLVPYRSLASELRGSLVKRLNQLGLSSRCAYGGTVPSGDEVRDLDDTRAIVATPEALSGLLSADPNFYGRVSLVVCDEGHLLDGQARGVGLELLLSRMRARGSGPPRFVFVSAIVPNIEEINAWLGGTDATVVRSDYRPSLAEFAVLRVSGTGASSTVALQLHPHEPEPVQFLVERFLTRDDFRFRNPTTGRLNTYGFSSVKTQAVAAARKALSMGAVAVFAANKRGSQGAVGLAEELLSQMENPLPLLEDRDRWLPDLGTLVLRNTVWDLSVAEEPGDSSGP